ncbi:MAG: hypothetical protein U1E65_11590 [Myxococcota bacterium]
MPVHLSPASTAAAQPLPTPAPAHGAAPKPTLVVGLGAVHVPKKSDAPSVGRGGAAKPLALGVTDGQALALAADGRILLGGKSEPDGSYRAAGLADHQGGLFSGLKVPAARLGKLSTRLAAELSHAEKQTGEAQLRARSGAFALLIDVAEAAPEASPLFKSSVDALLTGLEALPVSDLLAFTVRQTRGLLGAKLGPADEKRLGALVEKVLPSAAPVEAWTKNRTQPLEVRHTIHPEFWKEELAYFSKQNGFTLVNKNKADTERVYEGTLPDPNGKLPALKVHLVVRKDELDFLTPMNDPQVHVILYSGHSALGANGSESIAESGAMKGSLPKLVLTACCRGKDNYAAFMQKFPNAHFITTESPTYSESGQLRIRALFDMLAAGSDYASMRKASTQKFWDEPADNYFYPDEWRKFRFMDLDGDGKTDSTAAKIDRRFDVERHGAAQKFVRATAFANSELFYHWEVDHENGKKSYFGKGYGDAVIPAGPTSADKLVSMEKKGDRFYFRYDEKKAKALDENLYAAEVTSAIALGLTADKKKTQLDVNDAVRALLMGGQAVHYLDVYEDSAVKTYERYLERAGLGTSIDTKKVDKLYDDFDGHANPDQIEAMKGLIKKAGVDLAAWAQAFAAERAPAVA